MSEKPSSSIINKFYALSIIGLIVIAYWIVVAMRNDTDDAAFTIGSVITVNGGKGTVLGLNSGKLELLQNESIIFVDEKQAQRENARSTANNNTQKDGQ